MRFFVLSEHACSLLTCRDAAIVSPTPGTTRDVLSLSLDVAGYKVTVMDTAGLRSEGDAIEAEGMRRALVSARCVLVPPNSEFAFKIPSNITISRCAYPINYKNLDQRKHFSG